MQNFRSYKLAVQLYRKCLKLKLERHLQDQINRASSSVALNLSEGRGRRTMKDQRRFFDIAFGSLREVQAILDITNAHHDIIDLADKTAAHLYKLLHTLRHG
ncbi:MAG: four helix bundle protein [Bacteriovoracaceae bacterium]|nr:four helix bundle protein [Bacteriovoracaceae bacterium]